MLGFAPLTRNLRAALPVQRATTRMATSSSFLNQEIIWSRRNNQAEEPQSSAATTWSHRVRGKQVKQNSGKVVQDLPLLNT